jgi:hypothetical protein
METGGLDNDGEACNASALSLVQDSHSSRAQSQLCQEPGKSGRYPDRVRVCGGVML